MVVGEVDPEEVLHLQALEGWEVSQEVGHEREAGLELEQWAGVEWEAVGLVAWAEEAGRAALGGGASGEERPAGAGEGLSWAVVC